ncbi:MAG: hypothetical protein L0Y72_18425 [Gemmataceae bacterium]|nr:hypothetical protein [Gemmataceae bacterium]MCI0741028.1 hypothetical protein [Gemmataceae bacterium]
MSMASTVIGVFPGEFNWKGQEERWESKYPDDPVEYIARTPFDEFRVFAQRDDYFFLSNEGALYVAKPSPKKERIPVPVWEDKHRPITAVINDTNQKKTWFLGKDGKDKVFFFELAEKPHVREAQTQAIQPVDAREPLKTILEYTQLLPRAKSKKTP